MGIVGSDNKKWMPFTGNITVHIGKIIPYNEELMVQHWVKAIEELTGFKYLGERL